MQSVKSKEKSKLTRVVVGLTLLLVGSACDQRLSPAQATRALTARFAEIPPIRRRVFRSRCVEKYFEPLRFFFYEDSHTVDEYRALEAAGLVTQFRTPATAAQCGTPYPESLLIVGITLTPKGIGEHWPEHQEGVGGWDIPIGQRLIVEVTAILPQSPTLAHVRFQWQVTPTVAGTALGQTAHPSEGYATFRRDMDGWRLLPVGTTGVR